MISSMTGFCRIQSEFQGSVYTLEIKSLNGKFFDLKIRIPNSLRAFELDLRKLLTDALERGRAEVSIDKTYSSSDATSKLINEPLFLAYTKQLRALAESQDLTTNNILETVCRIPEVIKNNNDELSSEEETLFITELINKGIHEISTYRLREGEPLKQEFKERIGLILKYREACETYEPERLEKVRQRLKTQLEEIVNINPERLEQELIFYIEKFDISEEKMRLKQHCEYFLELIDSNFISIGKKLSFLSQEIGREINTLGAKSNHIEIQKLNVLMKDELEKIKEQINNIL